MYQELLRTCIVIVLLIKSFVWRRCRCRRRRGFLKLPIRERRRRRGLRLVKNDFIFYLRLSQLCKSVQYAYRSKNLLRLNMHRQRLILKEDTIN